MKLTLKILAILYLVLSILMFSAPYAIIRLIIDKQFSEESAQMIPFILPVIVIPIIGIFCSIRYLKRKDEESASNITVLTGIAVWLFTNALIPKDTIKNPYWIELASILFCISVGVYTHKLFYKYVKRSFGRNGA